MGALILPRSAWYSVPVEKMQMSVMQRVGRREVKQNAEQADERECAGMLAPDGRCKTLDASGDGYVRAEDCIVLLMTSLAEEGTKQSAQKVTALVHGTAVNQVRTYTLHLLCCSGSIADNAPWGGCSASASVTRSHE